MAEYLLKHILETKIDPLQDTISQIELIDSMGNDLSVVNDARASFERESNQLNEKDIKLIRYLIKFNHTSPFRGVTFKFKVKGPLYVARQWFKHVVASNHCNEQLGWNEKSLRYVEVSPEFYIPSLFRKQAEHNKQSSEGIIEDNATATKKYCEAIHKQYEVYTNLLEMGVCREQARGVLPTCIYTTWVWTVSLQAVLHFISLRRGKGAQTEIQAYAKAVLQLINPIVPETVQAWQQQETIKETVK